MKTLEKSRTISRSTSKKEAIHAAKEEKPPEKEKEGGAERIDTKKCSLPSEKLNH